MGKYKICIYAIAKNEEKFAQRFCDTVKDADCVIVLDTGSTDKTAEIMRNNGVNVFEKKIVPWRFDNARNEALKLIPDDCDICISLDIDEMLCPDWREKLENKWHDGVSRARYRYIWNFMPDGSEGHVFMADKIHLNKKFIWKYPVHEVLSYIGTKPVVTVDIPELTVSHRADETKSREQYLPLLELSVKENPFDDRNVHYLAREYMFKKRYDEAIEYFKRHLSLKTATWSDERAASMRYIARCLDCKGYPKEAVIWLYKSCAEAPHSREPLAELATFFYRHENWYGVIFAVNEALKITKRDENYITSPYSKNGYLYDIASIAFFNTGDKKSACQYAKSALDFAFDERIKNNLEFFLNS